MRGILTMAGSAKQVQGTIASCLFPTDGFKCQDDMNSTKILPEHVTQNHDGSCKIHENERYVKVSGSALNIRISRINMMPNTIKRTVN
jgi:hypothetical protein